MVSEEKNSQSYVWFQRAVDGLLINGKRARTAETYAREVRIFVNWFKQDPQRATEADLHRFILYRRNNCKLTGSSMRILCAGMRFFFTHIIPRNWNVLDLMNAKAERTLPIIITKEQAWNIIHATPEIQNRVYFQTVYTCGLRLSEALHLTVSDVRDKRMLHVRHGKGGVDRYVPLPESTYMALRKYWVTHRNPVLLFPRLGRSLKLAPITTEPMDVKTVQHALRRSLKRLNFPIKGIRIHTFRHCYATHLLEQGVNVRSIQRYLGHGCLETTMMYFHLTTYTDEHNHDLISKFMQEEGK